MKDLIDYFKHRIDLTSDELDLLKKIAIPLEVPAKKRLIEAGKVERYLYFLISGIVRGYKNKDGKLIVEHLVDNNNFFTSLDSFMTESPSTDFFETITDCYIYKISRTDFELLKQSGNKWALLIEEITNENLQCKMDRVYDFQTLTAKERYLKFVEKSPNLALNVSIENIASFLGMEPQSLSRIRKQIAI